MRSSLLAGCAAIALAGMCGTAAADGTPGKFDLKLSGDGSFTAGLVRESEDTDAALNALKARRDNAGDFVNRFRLQATATATADNGLEYGANIRLRAWLGTGTIDADQAYIFADGTWGRVEAGVTPGPSSQYGVAAPNGFGTGGVMGDWSDGPGYSSWLNNQQTYVGSTFGSEYNLNTGSNWATKINYFTPRFFAQDGSTPDNPTGLMGMLSYTPNNMSINTAVGRSSNLTIVPTGQLYTPSSDSLCGYNNPGLATNNLPNPSTPVQGCYWQNMVETGLRYDGTFSDISVSGSVGYVHGQAPTPVGYATFNDLDAYQVGLQLGYGAFLVGGSFLSAGKSGYTKGSVNYSGNTIVQKTDQQSFTGGIQYTNGPVVVGFNYAHGQDAGDMSLRGARTADLFSVGATYTLAPGLTTSLEWLTSQTHSQAGFLNYGSDYYGNTAQFSGNANMVLWKNVVTF